MKKSFLGVVLSLGLLSAAHADVYKFDNTHTNAVFNIDHFQTSTNHGGFYAISGELKYQPEKQVAEMRVTIPVSALNTGWMRLITIFAVAIFWMRKNTQK